MTNLLLLAAGFEDLIGIAIPVIFFVIWLINTIVSSRQQEQQNKTARSDYVSETQLNQEIQQFLSESEEQDYAFSNEGYDEPIEATLINDPNSSVSDLASHVQQHIGSQLPESRIGSTIDVQVDDHVHEVFDHQIGSLQSTYAKEQAEKQAAEDLRIEMIPKNANDFAALFQNSNNVRQAIIMQEILTRPGQR